MHGQRLFFSSRAYCICMCVTLHVNNWRLPIEQSSVVKKVNSGTSPFKAHGERTPPSHTHTKKKLTLVLSRNPTQRVEHTESTGRQGEAATQRRHQGKERKQRALKRVSQTSSLIAVAVRLAASMPRKDCSSTCSAANAFSRNTTDGGPSHVTLPFSITTM